MNTKLFFLILSCAMVILSIVTICIAPIINGNLPFSGSENCQKHMDAYDDLKKKSGRTSADEIQLKYYKQDSKICKREKAMFGLEYSSLIIDIVLGTLCCLLGLLHYLEIGKYFIPITGIIGLASGVIGFVLTVFYVGYSGYIFNNDYSTIELLYDNGATLKYDGTKYVHLWTSNDFNENQYADKAKYKEYGKKQYNYNSKLYKESLDSTDQSSIKFCNIQNRVYSDDGGITYNIYNLLGSPKVGNCEYIWKNNYLSEYDDYSYKYTYDKWITTIILSSFIFLCAIGVAVFGLLLFLNKGD